MGIGRKTFGKAHGWDDEGGPPEPPPEPRCCAKCQGLADSLVWSSVGERWERWCLPCFLRKPRLG